MVCEFLPPDFKKKLVEIATINDLMNAGYSKMGAYKAKEKGVMSDEKCEKLVDLLGDRAWGVFVEALIKFASELNCEVDCPLALHSKNHLFVFSGVKGVEVPLHRDG